MEDRGRIFDSVWPATNPNEASGLIPPVVRFASLRHRQAYFEPDSKREGTLASFDAQASRARIATRHAAPTPCSQSGHLRRLELAQWRLRRTASMKSGGDVLAPGHLLQVQRHPERHGSRRCQALLAGRHLLRRCVKMNSPRSCSRCMSCLLPNDFRARYACTFLPVLFATC